MELTHLTKLIEEKVSEYGYELISLASRVEKGENILSIIVDRVEPIDMEAIVDISHKLNAYIDEINPIDSAYTLDISSLGAEKPLKIEELDKYVNRYVYVHLINPINGENIYEGVLDEVKDNELTLSYKDKTRTKTIKTGLDNIYKVRLAIKF